ncbi:hypothetical protein DIPPA_02404 [Diplonema papillatum]|nr:hypothetical protein DIPPA_02404 [Diplonema papillatum]
MEEVPKNSDVGRFKVTMDAMVNAMDQAKLDEWLRTYGIPGVTLIVSPQLSDPEKDGRAYGQEQVLAAYNALVPIRFPPEMTWEFREEIRQLTRSVFQVDMFSKEPTGERIERVYYTVVQEDLTITQILRCPAEPEEISPGFIREVAAFQEAAVDITAGKPPCWHNSWDSVRARQACSVLRCRECSVVWRLTMQQLREWTCADFPGNCPLPRGLCRKVHLHERKLRVHEKKMLAGAVDQRASSSANEPPSHLRKPGKEDERNVASQKEEGSL